MINIAVRFDDPSAVSSTEIEEGVIAALESTETQATFAVIPFVQKAGKAVELKEDNSTHLIRAHQRGLIEVAVHGHSHVNRGSKSSPSEFHGLSSTAQSALVRRSLDHLRTLFGEDAIHGFVPPWNSFDLSTALAVEDAGLKYISAGKWLPTSPYRGKLIFAPRTCRFVDFELAIAEARYYSAFDPCVIVVLHHYDFHESGSDGSQMNLSDFEAIMQGLVREKDIHVMPVHALAEANRNRALARPVKSWLREEYLPWRLRARLPRKCMLNAPMWRQVFRAARRPI